MYACVYVRVYVCMYVCMHACMYVGIYVSMCCVYICEFNSREVLGLKAAAGAGSNSKLTWK